MTATQLPPLTLLEIAPYFSTAQASLNRLRPEPDRGCLDIFLALQDAIEAMDLPNSMSPPIDLKKTAHSYGGIKAYGKAKEDGLTKLEFEPWLIARSTEFKNWFGDWERAANHKFLEGTPILNLNGTEFTQAEGTVLDRVSRYYAEHWQSGIAVKGIGRVSLDRRAVENSLCHGVSRYRIMSFAAVPYLLEKGRIVHSEPIRGSQDGKVHHVAAPIGIRSEGFVGSVLIKDDVNGRRLFTHQVFVKDKLQSPRQEYGAVAATLAGKRSVRGNGAMRRVLSAIYSVNLNSVSKDIDDETKEPIPEAVDSFLSLTKVRGIAIYSAEAHSPYKSLNIGLQEFIYLAKRARRVTRSAASDEAKAQAIGDLEAAIRGVTGPRLTAIPLKRILMAFAQRRCSERNLIKAAVDHDRATTRRFELSQSHSRDGEHPLGIDL